VNLAPNLGSTRAAYDSIPTDVTISGTLSVNGALSPFTGTLTDSTTFKPDGSQTDVDTFVFSTNFGPLTGTISAPTTPVLVVPEPSTWVMMLFGFADLGFAGYRRAKSGHATLRLGRKAH
jgi:hypothetical protein